MMILLFVLEIAWIFRIVINTLTYVHLWRVKEYRIDRMLIHLKTNQGKRLLFSPARRPPVSPKSIAIFLASLCVLTAGYILLPWGFIIKLFVLDILSFPVTALFVIFSKLPTAIYHRFHISQAVKMLRAHKKMKVIGITGSYGKTSTKEILYTLLSQKYVTLKTEASKNSPIAIAELILTKLTPRHEAFVVEMGAYKKGEIAQMCDMVLPEIGIVTAINEQHQDLFGSLETTMKAKYELIQGLVDSRIAIFNGDNSYTKEMASWGIKDGCQVKYFSVSEKDKTVTAYASDIESTIEGTSFMFHYAKTKKSIHVPLLGRHHVGNILAAMTAAIACGMTVGEAIEACKHIQPFPKTMQRRNGIGESYFIDDTYNNNPDAAKAAVDFLATAHGRKIFVFQPMIELGQYAEGSHKEVGAYAARICDDIILTNDNYYESFIQGVHSVGSDKKIRVLSPGEAASYIQRTVKKGDCVLFKGKESARILDLLSSE